MADPVPAARIVRGACPHDCPDTCAWLVTTENGVATKLTGDPGHPITRGGLCAKVNHFLERVYSPDRVLHPLRRSGPKGSGEFQRVSWDEALADIGARLNGVIAEHGATAVLPFSYFGTQGLLQGMSLSNRFFAHLGATRLTRAVCGGAGSAGAGITIGTNIGMMPEDIVHSRFIILWGTNTVVTNLHLWPLIRAAKANGATIVAIDPARTRTAQAADWHVQPNPGTDAALALGLMHVIVAENLHDSDYVDHHTLGFEQLLGRLAEYPPARVSEICGIEADEIVRLARAYATSQPAAIRMLMGMEHRANGAMIYRTVSCLPALVGAWRHQGGGLLYLTAGLHFNAMNSAGVQMPELEDRSIREFNMVQIGRVLTDQSLDPPIKALIVYGSNPAATMPNQQLILQGLQRDDLFTVVHEQFLTDTARHADYVLPATTQIEHADLMWSWGHDYLTLNQPAIPPLGEAVPTTEFIRRLARAMGLTADYLYTSDEQMISTALESESPLLDGITEERLLKEGWARLNRQDGGRPFADGGFPTASGKCEFYSAAMATAGLDPLPAYEAPRESPRGDRELAARYPLSLITAKGALHFLNSSYANLPRHLKAEQEPRLEIHPDDAACRGIGDGDTVRVFNDRAEVQLRARVGNGIRTGAVAMPSGWWASLSPGGTSANALTADGISDLGDGGDFHDTLVEVEGRG
jgi:anaerobic selenocysteine-containing dehydrogenase